MRKREAVDLEELIEAPPLATKSAAPVPMVVKPAPLPEGASVDEVEELIKRAEDYFGAKIAGLDEVQRLVIVMYLKHGNISRACVSVGVSITSHQRWLRESQPYREVFLAADNAITDLLEETAIRNALRTGDPRLLSLLLKGRRRDKYGHNPGTGGDRPPQSWADLTKKMSSEDEEDAVS